MQDFTDALHRNLVSASRVIFCEPVWQANVETQAIKVGVINYLLHSTGLIWSRSVCIVSDRHVQLPVRPRRGQSFYCLLADSRSVKTLAIRSTAEEFMVSRRDDLKRGLGAAGGKLPNIADDTSMRKGCCEHTEKKQPRSKWQMTFSSRGH